MLIPEMIIRTPDARVYFISCDDKTLGQLGAVVRDDKGNNVFVSGKGLVAMKTDEVISAALKGWAEVTPLKWCEQYISLAHTNYRMDRLLMDIFRTTLYKEYNIDFSLSPDTRRKIELRYALKKYSTLCTEEQSNEYTAHFNKLTEDVKTCADYERKEMFKIYAGLYTRGVPMFVSLRQFETFARFYDQHINLNALPAQLVYHLVSSLMWCFAYYYNELWRPSFPNSVYAIGCDHCNENGRSFDVIMFEYFPPAGVPFFKSRVIAEKVVARLNNWHDDDMCAAYAKSNFRGK